MENSKGNQMIESQNYSSLSSVFKSDGQILKGLKDGRKKTTEDFKEKCFHFDIFVKKDTLHQQYEDCVRQLNSIRTQATPEDAFLDLIESLKKEDLFKDFILLDDGEGNPYIQYKNPLNGIKKIIGTLEDMTPNFIFKKILSETPHFLDRYVELLSPYSKLLGLKHVNQEIACEQIWFKLFTGTFHLKREFQHKDQMPIGLIDSTYPCNEYISYETKYSKLTALEPSLSNFLERTSNHKYMCAMIASRLLGFRRPYIPCLVGDGEDGKSTFTSFLDRLVNGYTAQLDMKDPYGLFDCVGKLFLFISDTSNSKVFYYETLKQISGNDAVRVQAKYRHAKNVKLPGMIMIATNSTPKLTKKEWLNRRARIFKVSPLEASIKKNLLTIDMTVTNWMTTSNAFINYCVQCLKEVGNIETGLVKDLPDQVDTLEQEGDSQTEEFEDFLQDLKMTVGEDMKITGYKLRQSISYLCREQHKNEYFKENFMTYLKTTLNVTRSSRYFIGIGFPEKEQTTHTTIRVPAEELVALKQIALNEKNGEI